MLAMEEVVYTTEGYLTERLLEKQAELDILSERSVDSDRRDSASKTRSCISPASGKSLIGTTIVEMHEYEDDFDDFDEESDDASPKPTPRTPLQPLIKRNRTTSSSLDGNQPFLADLRL